LKEPIRLASEIHASTREAFDMEFEGSRITDLVSWGDSLYIASDDAHLITYNFQTMQKNELDTYLQGLWKGITLIEADQSQRQEDHPLMIVSYREREKEPHSGYMLYQEDPNTNLRDDLALQKRHTITGDAKFQLKFQQYDLCNLEFRKYLPKMEGNFIYAGNLAPDGRVGVVSTGNGKVHIFNPRTQKSIHREVLLHESGSTIDNIIFSQDSKFMFTSDTTGVVRQWEVLGNFDLTVERW
jgi:WD40 repeat protein